MPKNPQTTTQLQSSHTLAKWCSKFSKTGFNSRWTVKFQMFKLDLEKAEEPEIKWPTSVGPSKKENNSRKHLLLLYCLCQSLCVKKRSEVTQSCPTLCDPMDCSLPGFSTHGTFQARVQEWAAISLSRGSSRDQTHVFCTVGRHFTVWATKEIWLCGSQ